MLAKRRVAASAAAITLAALAALALMSGQRAALVAAPPDRDCPSGSCNDPSNSFEPDTPVRMADGSLRRLDAVLVGDLVATLAGTAEVRGLVRGTGYKDLVEVNGTLTATAGHRLLTRRGWVSAGQLMIGDVLTGPTTPVRVTTLHTIHRYATVVNLDVAGPGIYLVAANGTDVTVHE